MSILFLVTSVCIFVHYPYTCTCTCRYIPTDISFLSRDTEFRGEHKWPVLPVVMDGIAGQLCQLWGKTEDGSDHENSAEVEQLQEEIELIRQQLEQQETTVKERDGELANVQEMVRAIVNIVVLSSLS